MHDIIYTNTFIEDMTGIYSDKLQADIFSLIDLLPSMPILGSTNLPEYIVSKYGPQVRKIPVSPFLVVYKIVEDEDFLILGLVHERQAF